jgi:hypothetical protein
MRFKYVRSHWRTNKHPSISFRAIPWQELAHDVSLFFLISLQYLKISFTIAWSSLIVVISRQLCNFSLAVASERCLVMLGVLRFHQGMSDSTIMSRETDKKSLIIYVFTQRHHRFWQINRRILPPNKFCFSNLSQGKLMKWPSKWCKLMTGPPAWSTTLRCVHLRWK